MSDGITVAFEISQQLIGGFVKPVGTFGEMQQEYGDRIGDKVDYQLIVLDGHVSSEILTFLNENPVDIAVMGSYGLSGMGLVFFGSVAKRISYKAPCSVMIVRAVRDTP